MIRLLSGDARDVLPTLPAESVQCVVTSPPYYGLRDYQTALWDGGDADCRHVGEVSRTAPAGTAKQASNFGANGVTSGDCCRCGAVRVDRQIGLEATPDEYLATMVQVFREVRRVLRRDGTCWVNMGDSYASGEVGRHDHKQAAGLCPSGALLRETEATVGRKNIGLGMGAREQRALTTGLPAKNLLLMPARLALALQADGWWVRSEITWCKKNPMPESVRDRPTNATEKVYLLTKNKTYFYDAIATREFPGETGVVEGSDFANQGVVLGLNLRTKHHSPEWAFTPSGVPHDRRLFEDAIKCATTILQTAQSEQQLGLFALDAEKGEQGGGNGSGSLVGCSPDEHGIAALATRFLAGDMAPKGFLHEIDRLSPGLSKGDVLGIGGGAAERLHAPTVYCNGNAAIAVDNASEVGQDDFARHEQECATQPPTASRNMRNWWLMSTHAFPNAHFATFPPELAERCIKAGTRPGDTVLDPFAGAGTTLLVADRLQRDAIGIELNVSYTEMAMERCRQDAPLFTSFPPAEPPEDERMADLFAGDEYERPTPSPKPMQVPRGWDTGPGAHGTIHRTGRTISEAAD